MIISLRQNLKNMAISQYKNFSFDRGIVETAHGIFGLSQNKLCKLFASEADDGTPIQSMLMLSTSNLDGKVSRLRSMHISGSFNDKAAISLSYAMDSYSDVNTQCSLAKTGNVSKGKLGSLKFNGQRSQSGVYATIKIQNNSGAYFRIDEVSCYLISRNKR